MYPLSYRNPTAAACCPKGHCTRSSAGHHRPVVQLSASQKRNASRASQQNKPVSHRVVDLNFPMRFGACQLGMAHFLELFAAHSVGMKPTMKRHKLTGKPVISKVAGNRLPSPPTLSKPKQGGRQFSSWIE